MDNTDSPIELEMTDLEAAAISLITHVMTDLDAKAASRVGSWTYDRYCATIDDDIVDVAHTLYLNHMPRQGDVVCSGNLDFEVVEVEFVITPMALNLTLQARRNP